MFNKAEEKCGFHNHTKKMIKLLYEFKGCITLKKFMSTKSTISKCIIYNNNMYGTSHYHTILPKIFVYVRFTRTLEPHQVLT